MQDWDGLRFFLALARHKTLAAAAKQLNVTQSTVSRRVAALQDMTGVQLLHRSVDGYVLTQAGESIRAHVERVEAETLSVERAVAGHNERMEGPVRIACSELLASHMVIPSLAGLTALHPGIVIEAMADRPGEALTANDIDIAVRLRPFETPDLIVRKVGTIAFGLYACVAYLARYGTPDVANGCRGHRLIALASDGDASAQSAWLAEHATAANVVLRANSYETQHSAAFNGTGLALLPCFRADAEQVLRRVPSGGVAIPPAAIWIGTHSASKSIPRVRRATECIAEAIRGKSRQSPPELMLASA